MSSLVMLIKTLGPKFKQPPRDGKMIMNGRALMGGELVRMRIARKGKGDKGDIDYGIITVTSVVYKVKTQIRKNRLRSWAEGEGMLQELQNRSCKQRWLEDNLYPLTQCIETVKKEHRPLWLAFLDIKKAYNSVNHVDLWNILGTLYVEDEVTNLLKDVYKSNKVLIKLEIKRYRNL